MALGFTSISDREGPAVYIMGSGTSSDEARLKRFGEDIDKLTPEKTQTVYLDPHSPDGLKVMQFYGLMSLPCVMIVMDDDTLYQLWEHRITAVDHVAYRLSQAGGSSL